MKPENSKAYIQFSTVGEANAALKSPKAVFGNRFIRTVPSRKYLDKTDSEAVTVPIKKTFHPHQSESKPNIPARVTPPPPSLLSASEPVAQRPTSFKLENKPKLSKSEVQKLEKDLQEKRRLQLEQAKKLLDSLSTMPSVDPTVKAQLLQKIKNLSETVGTSLSKDSELLQKQMDEKTKKINLKLEKEKELLDRELDRLQSQPKENVEENQSSEDTKLASSSTEKTNTTPPPDGIQKSDPYAAKLKQRYNSLQKMVLLFFFNVLLIDQQIFYFEKGCLDGNF